MAARVSASLKSRALRSRLCVTILSVACSFATRSHASDFYVSPLGSDINAGTSSKPFATLERARDAVRNSQQGRTNSGKTASVTLLAGNYFRTNSLELAAADSTVVWQAAKGQGVRLLGGRVLSGFVPVTNVDALPRLPKNARSNVVQLGLSSLGITDFGEMKSRGFARSTAPAHCELFYAGKPMALARWPNEGEWDHIAGFPATGSQADG